MDTSDNYNLFTDATSIPIDGEALSGLSTAKKQKKAPKPNRVKKPPKLDLSTAINPLVDDETKPVNYYKKPTGKKSASSSSCASFTGCAAVIDTSYSEKHDVSNGKHGELGGESDSDRHDEPSGKNDGYDGCKDSVIAERLTGILKNTLCFDDVSSEWYAQHEYLWRPVSKKRATKIIARALSSIWRDGYSMAKLNSIEAFLTLNLLIDAWENGRNLLPMKNGILDISTRTLVTDRGQYRFNWQLPYKYETDAKINVITEWLEEATGNDDEAIGIIRAFFKMALIGGEVQKFLELIGAGGTGKSTLTRLLVAFVGERNQVTTDLKNLEGNRFEGAALYGKRLALINDSSRYGGEVSVLKAITGGDAIRFERKNQQQGGSFVYEGVVVVASNEAIQTADYTSGLIRRRMPVMFNRKVTDGDKAKWASVGGIEAAMKKELPGLLVWVLSMTDDEVKAVIGGINGAMTRTQRNHLIETNKIAEWLDDNTVITEGAVTYIGKSTSGIKDSYEADRIVSEKLYSNYERWCGDSNYHPVALNRFSANVTDVCEQLKFNVAKHKNERGAYLKGLVIRNESHANKPTPVTKTLFNDDDNDVSSGENDVSMTYQHPVNDGTDAHDALNPVVINNKTFGMDRGRI